ncbi:MAG: hypothetical protein ACRD1N_08550 [Terriglobia bacterium]
MDVERTIQFILEMQAKHEVFLQKHEEAMQRHEQAMQRHDEAITRIDAAVEANTGRIAQLVDVCMSLANNMENGFRAVREEFRQLREVQSSTEYKLNALIDTVDKLVRNGGRREQNGRAN